MAGNTVVVSVLAETAKFKKGMSDLGKFGAAAGKAVAVGLAAVGAAAVAAGAYSVNLAKNYEQTAGAMKTLYGPELTSNMEKWNAGLAKSIGVSKASAAEIQKDAAIQVRALGLSGSAAEQYLQKHTANMADVGAMFNATAEQVAEAHSAVMRGEYDSAEKYGVQITAAMVKQKMAAEGLTEVQARQALWTEQSAIANGQAAKEANSAAGAQERLKATVDNLALTFGEALLPALTLALQGILDFATAVGESPQFQAFVDWLQNVAIPAIQSFASEIVDGVVKGLTDLSNWYNENSEILNTLAVMVGAAAAVWAIWTGAIAIWTAVTTAATAAQALFNAIMAANPIMLVVMAVAALVAGLVYFFTQTETGRAMWASFTAFLRSSWDGIVKFFNATLANVKAWFKDAGDNVKRTWEGVQQWFSGLPARIRAFFSSAASWLTTHGKQILDGLKRGAETGWSAVSSFLGSIPGKVKGAFSGAVSWLYTTGSNILAGLWNGISDKVGWVVSKVRGIGSQIISAAKSVFGVQSPSRVFKEIGSFLSVGLANGIMAESDLAREAAKKLGAMTTGAFDAEFATDGVSPGRGNVYVFNGVEINSNARLEDALSTLADEITHYAGVGV